MASRSPTSRAHRPAPAALVFLLAASGLLFQPAPLSAQTATTLEPVASVEGITEYRLDNGLRVLLFPDQTKPEITVNITYLVGSRHEGYGETGMAHLLEHLVFKGTPDHPDITQELTERGARPNGSTWYDRTNYFETFPASEDNLAWALDLEADRMVNSFISAEDLESEMTVVRNEMESGENNPFNILMQRVLSTAYLWHGYGRSTIGARSDVENVPIDRLKAFYEKYYQPDNAILVVSGKFDEARALELIQREFGALTRPERTGGMRLWPTYTAEPTQDGERSVTLRRVGEQKALVTAYHVPPGSHEDFAPVQVLSHVMGNQPSGRLYKALVETEIATSAGSFAWQLKEAGPLIFYARLRPDGDLDRTRTVLDETVADLLANPATEEEVERARTQLLKNIELSLNNTTRIALGLSEWAAMGDWRLFFLHRDRLEAVTPEDVHRVTEAYLKPSNRTVGVFQPVEEPVRAEVPAPPDINELVGDYQGREVVAEGEAFDPSPENVDARTTTFELDNGMKVALLPKENRGESVVARLRLEFGDLESVRGRVTAGSLAGSMLMRGTERLTRQEISDEMDRLKARGGIGGGATLGTGQFETTRENLPAVLRLMAEIARTPRFDPKEFEVLKEQRLAGLESQKTEPGPLGNIALRRRMDPLPEDHPDYTPTIEESISRLEGTTLDEVRSFHHDFYGPQSGNVVVVGDFDPDEIRAVLDEAFGDWESPHPFARIPGEAVDVPGETMVIETPDKANAFFFAQQNLALTESDPDYPALVIAGYMIGGGFLNSRLAKRIRGEEGLSYSVAGGIDAHPVDPDGSFSAFAIYAPENGERLEEVFKEEVNKVIEEGFTTDELAAAKKGWLESRQLSRAQDASLASRLSSHLYFERTMHFDKSIEEKVEALSVDEVNAAVRRWLDLSKISIVKAGDFAGVEEGVGSP